MERPATELRRLQHQEEEARLLLLLANDARANWEPSPHDAPRTYSVHFEDAGRPLGIIE